jgi:hypothetical protein
MEGGWGDEEGLVESEERIIVKELLLLRNLLQGFI